jgi:hypothetical protein
MTWKDFNSDFPAKNGLKFDPNLVQRLLNEKSPVFLILSLQSRGTNC